MGKYLLAGLVAWVWLASVPAVQAADERAVAELREQAEALRDQARKAVREGNESAARELAAKADELSRRAHEMSGPRRPGEERPLPERLEGMKREIAELRKNGHHAEAERLQQEMREFVERQQKAGRPGEDGRRADIERRVNHIRVAVENLHAAGLHEPAEQLMREAERAMQEAAGHDPEAALRQQVREMMDQLRRLNERLDRLERALSERSGGGGLF